MNVEIPNYYFVLQYDFIIKTYGQLLEEAKRT